jgi:hypothetical protein
MMKEKIKLYLDHGINCIAVDEHKRPFTSWKQYQSEFITHDALIQQYADTRAAGIAIICGKISGNLEVIDIDCKYDLTKTLYEDIIEAIPTPLLKKILIIKTKNGGYHLYYRCKTIGSNRKLATRPATPEEAEAGDKFLVLIETRGEGGYVVAPPTDGYARIGSRSTIEIITEKEREMLFSIMEHFNQVKQEPHHKIEFKPPADHDPSKLTPWADYDARGVSDIIERLVAAGWRIVRKNEEKVVFLRPGNTDSKSSGDFNLRLGWFSVFTTSSEFEPNRAYRPSAVFSILEKIKDGKELYGRLHELGYGMSEPIKQLRRVTGKNSTRAEGGLKKNSNPGPNHGAGPDSSGSGHPQPNLDEEVVFFDEFRGVIKIASLSFLAGVLYKKGGFGLYRYADSKDYVYVRLLEGIADVATVVDMKKFTEEYIDTVYESPLSDALKQAVQAQAEKLFSKSTLEFLPFMELNLLRHTPTTAYYPFRNGILKVTAEKEELIPYKDIHMHVWRSHIIDFDYNIGSEIDFLQTDFYRFVAKICNDDPERILYVGSIIGYLLHTYKDNARPYAIILAEETENEDNGGGTGKGIFFRALGKIINTIVVDGKSFKHDKPFLFQRASVDTQLIVIDDCRKNLDFQGFYSHITEGLTIEKKNKDEIHIPYSDSPKFLFSTNYTINIDGSHGRRRAKVVEFSDFFHDKNTPLDFFGHMLFEGWDERGWNEFYATMAMFVRGYLADGVVERGKVSPTIFRKEVALRYSKEFVEFWDDLDKDGNWVVLLDLYQQFLMDSGYEKKDYSPKKFSMALAFCAEYYNHAFLVKKNSMNGGKRECFICPK